MTRPEFNTIVYKLSRKLYSYAFRILRNQEQSEDAVQEVFIKLWKMKDKLSEYGNLDALAATMVKNYCIDQIRKSKFVDPNGLAAFPGLHSTGENPHDELEKNESTRLIKHIIGRLPDIYRQVVELRDIEEFSYEEIVVMTGQNINTLRVNLSRARKMIRDEYKKYYDEFRGNKTIA